MGGFRSTVNVPFQRAFDPSANFTSAGKLFSGIADRIDTRAKNKAINELLQIAPIQDEQVVGKGSEPMLNVPTGQVYNQSPLDFQQQQQQAFSQVNGIDPLMALGLAQKQATPYFNQEATQQTQSNADRLFGFDQTKEKNLQQYRTDDLDYKNKTIPKAGVVTTDNGETWTYDQRTGKFIEKKGNGSNNGANGSGSVGSKNIVLKEIEMKDGNGNVVKQQVPVNKVTGNIIINGVDSGKPAQSTERPKPTQADRDAAMSTKKAFDNIANIETLYSSDIVGPIDNTAAWIANATGTAQKGGDAQRNYQLNQEVQNLKANLTAALIKGVPSDKDMQVIEDMLPNTSDSEAVFAAKTKRIKTILERQNELSKEQAAKSGQSGMYAENSTNVSASGRPIIYKNGKWVYGK